MDRCCDDCSMQVLGTRDLIDSDTSSEFREQIDDTSMAHVIVCTSPEKCENEKAHAKLQGANAIRSHTGSEYPTKLALAKRRAVMETPST